LLLLELTPAFFGYFHGMNLLTTVLLNLLGSRMLIYCSTKMMNLIWLMRDEKNVEVEFMNAFFSCHGPKSTPFTILAYMRRVAFLT
jgi:hypothetical protein